MKNHTKKKKSSVFHANILTSGIYSEIRSKGDFLMRDIIEAYLRMEYPNISEQEISSLCWELLGKTTPAMLTF